MQKPLENRVALVTGGASGIGRETALLLASDGARVCIADLDGAGAKAVAKEIHEAGGEAIACVVNVAEEGANEDAVAKAVERFGALHIAHLNAGIAKASSVIDGDIGVFDQVIAVNLRGVYLGMRAVAPAMIAAGGGSLIATASVAGLRGGQGMPSYYASKHGVVGLVKAAAIEFAPHKIRVNAVCPGIIDTPILGPGHKNELVTDLLGRAHLLGRVGQPSEVAAVVSFLASDRASFITGAMYTVDGGMTASLGGGSSQPDESEAETLKNLLSER